MSGLFVTGAGTEIGKTFVACALLHQLRRDGRTVRALKPVISGYDANDPAASDSGRLLTALGETPSEAGVARISPWRYAAPLAPNMAAAREGNPIRLSELVGFCRAALHDTSALTVIEGVGGVMAPLTDTETVIDWMAELACPALLVTGSYLGAISHALSAAGALAYRGVDLLGVVVSESDASTVGLSETVNCITRLLPGRPVYAMPRLASYEEAPTITGMLGRREG